jgi:hypothetical protein
MSATASTPEECEERYCKPDTNQRTTSREPELVEPYSPSSLTFSPM